MQDEATDAAIAHAATIVLAAQRSGAGPQVRSFFDEATFTASHVVHDPLTGAAAVIDPVLAFDPATGRTSTEPVDQIADYLRSAGLQLDWLVETHVHADHLSAASYLQGLMGGRTAIGRGVLEVQETFGRILEAEPDFRRDGSQFDRLFSDGEVFALGGLSAVAVGVPGHTPADMAFVFGDAAFVGDTLFMPDYGTARADFPGGCARQLYRSIRRLLSLPRETRLFLCHDYKAPGRDVFAWETTVGAQRDGNIQIRDGIDEDSFVAMRTVRDSALAQPKLIVPSVQANMRGGRLPAGLFDSGSGVRPAPAGF